MLTDEERNHLLSIADTVASLHAVDADYRRGHCIAAAERIRAIAAPRVTPSPTPDICAAIEQAAAWIELGEIGATPDGEALVATLRGFTRAPRVATVGELLGTAPIGAVVEWTSRRGTATRARVGDAGFVSQFVRGAWGPYAFALRTSDLRLPARVADEDTTTSCGPIGEG